MSFPLAPYLAASAAVSDLSPAAGSALSGAPALQIGLFDTCAVLLVMAAIFGFINYKVLRLPSTIAFMLMGLLVAAVLSIVGHFVPSAVEPVRAFVKSIDFNETVMNCLLSFLLFAGALHVNLDDLFKNRYVISLMASFGVVVSTFVVAILTHFVQGWLGLDLPFVYCLVFGALISPTDPIAVLSIMKKVGAPKSLETKMAGESLFNDGVGVVVFLVLLGIATGSIDASTKTVAQMFLHEAGGGVVIGLLLGCIAYLLLKQVDDYDVEILITLALVMGGYSLAMKLHASGPLAMVVAGLWIGNYGRRLAMSEKTRQHLDTFWELIDELLNAMLFILLGLELLILSFDSGKVMLGLLAIPIVLLARFIAVSVPVSFLKRFREFTPGVIPILTWGGLRGGISVALALSIPEGPQRDLILVATYFVVIFSIAVQGLSVGRLIQRKTAGMA